MTLAEKLRNEGKLEGLAEGEKKGEKRGEKKGLREAIELGITLKFPEDIDVWMIWRGSRSGFHSPLKCLEPGKIIGFYQRP